MLQVFHTVLNVSTKKVIGKGIKKGGSHQLLWYSHSVVYSKYCPLLSSYMILEIDKKIQSFLQRPDRIDRRVVA